VNSASVAMHDLEDDPNIAVLMAGIFARILQQGFATAK